MSKIELSKPIKAFGKELKELDIKEPTGEHFEKIGVPLKFNSDGSFDIDGKKMILMIESLADLPAGTMKSVPFKEVLNISTKIMDFFV